ncbi:uracil-DNA glycosylase [Halobacillus litoralis]|uniref:uracil-DNA glycosylase n=1 Tax=Halobacillus litoralis TaxID=45668 RepID=UPI001CFC8B8D|nr:uracil-DNA glycosylase [Halobacillus litoralis]
MQTLKNDWEPLLERERKKDYFRMLDQKVQDAYEKERVFPEKSKIFAALEETPLEDTKVVILGQDPYHGEDQAHGFSFSVQPGIKIPPSLRNIYKELENDLGITAPDHGFLVHWAHQGVLLLNDVLTVKAHEPHSHKGIGWEIFTDAVVDQLNKRDRPVVFMLWGKHAQKKGSSIDHDKHLVIQSSHPSPFAAHRSFFGSRPFSRANDFLREKNLNPVDWKLPTATNQY